MRPAGTTLPDSGHAERRLLAVALVCGVADAVVLAALVRQDLWLASAAHFAVAASPLMVRGERALALNASLAIALLGPLGALTAVLIMVLATKDGSAGAAQYRELLREEPLDRVHAMHTAIAEGRAYAPGMTWLPHFASVLSSGSIVQKQAVLGLLSQHFHPDHRPLLEAALKSPETPVRVLAAAVYVKTRENIRSRLAHLLSEAARPDARESTAMELARCAFSGVLDAAEARQARSAALKVLLRVRTMCVCHDDAEEVICRLLTEEGMHPLICERLWPHRHVLPPVLKSTLAHALMRSARHRDLAELYGKLGGAAHLREAVS